MGAPTGPAPRDPDVLDPASIEAQVEECFDPPSGTLFDTLGSSFLGRGSDGVDGGDVVGADWSGEGGGVGKGGKERGEDCFYGPAWWDVRWGLSSDGGGSGREGDVVGGVVEGTDAGAGAVVMEGVVALEGVVLEPEGYFLLMVGGFRSEIEGREANAAVCVRGTPEEDLKDCFAFEARVGKSFGGNDHKTA